MADPQLPKGYVLDPDPPLPKGYTLLDPPLPKGYTLVDPSSPGQPSEANASDYGDGTPFGVVKHMVGKWWDQVNPIAASKGLVDAAKHPVDTASAIASQGNLGNKAYDAFKRGDYVEGIAHAVYSLLPVIGPTLDQAGQAAAHGDIPGAVGTTLGVATNLAAPELVKRIPTSVPVLPEVATHLTPAEQSAVALADQEGIPISAATRTGNNGVRNTQGFVQNTVGGSGVAQQAVSDTRAAMTKTGQNIADQIAPDTSPEVAGAVTTEALADHTANTTAAMAKQGQRLADRIAPETTPENAGTGVSKELQDTATAQGTQATAAYKRLSDIEQDPANIKTVKTGEKTETPSTPDGRPLLDASGNPITRTTDITEDVPLPVDMKTGKAALQPIYDRLTQEMPLAQQQASKGLQALKNVLQGPDVLPASVAESNLGALKAILRENVNDKTKFLARKAIDSVAPAIDAAVANGGKEAIDALNEGRQLTAAKYATRRTMDQLPDEPVKLFQKLTTGDDTTVALLRDVTSKAPGAIPAVGRAYVQGLLDTALNPDTPGTATGAWNSWNKLGDNTKNLLFTDPQLVKNLDDFFNMAKNRTLEQLPSEPVNAFNALTAPMDRAISLLRDVAAKVPQTMPAVGRAYIQKLFDTALDPDKPGGAAGAWAEWNKMGPGTKNILFKDPATVKKLDDFFTLAKMEGTNPNPSGTAFVQSAAKHVGNLVPAMGFVFSAPHGVIPAIAGTLATEGSYMIGTRALAKMLYDPKLSALVMKGMKMPISNKIGAALTAGQLLKAAGVDAKVIEFPRAPEKAAQNTEPENDNLTAANEQPRANDQ